MTPVLFSAAVLTTCYLLGDRRGVKQCNAILNENWHDLMQAIKEEPLPHTEREQASPTLH